MYIHFNVKFMDYVYDIFFILMLNLYNLYIHFNVKFV
jgi:hypothetical protein